MPDSMTEDANTAIEASLLAAMSHESRQRVLDGAVRVDVPAGSVIYREEEEPRCVLIVSGLVRVFMTAPNGRQVTVRYATRGEILGVPTIVGGPAPVSVQILTAAEFLFLNARALRDLGQHEPGVGWLLAREITERLYDTLEGLAAATFGSLRQRVARHLLDLASTSDDGRALSARVSQQELADAVGSVRPAVARVIGELRDEGLVVPSPGRIEILRPIDLHAEAWAREV